ncbi:MAG: hypothetical protein RR585_12380, partial [Coprobacillus sp.]
RENKVTIKVKLNQKLDPKYNDIYLFAEKEDNALEAQIIGKTEEHFWLERDSEDSSVFVSEAKNMDRYWKAGEYRITYLGVTALSEPEGENFSQDVISKQLVKLDKTISDKNSFKVENAFFEMFQPTVKSISLDKTNYKEGDTVKVTVKTQLPSAIEDGEAMYDELNLTLGTGNPADNSALAGSYLDMKLDLQSDGTTYYGETELPWLKDGTFKLQKFLCYGKFANNNWGGLFEAKFDKSIDLSKAYFTINNGTDEDPNVPEINTPTLIENIKKAQPGDSITINMKEDTVLTQDILTAVKGKDVTLLLEMDGYNWTINGKTVSKDIGQDINMGVDLNSKNISNDLIATVAGSKYTKQISLAYSGDFGFDANLQFNFDQAQANKNSKLYYFNNGKLELMSNSQIDANGKASYKFTHASDYVIVVEDNEKSTVVKTDDKTQMSSVVVAALGSLVLGAVIFIQLRKKKIN